MQIFSRTSLVLMVFILTSVPFWAEGHPPVVIKNSRSPDGRKDLVFVNDAEKIALIDGCLKIRAVSTGKILGTLPWTSGYVSSVHEGTFEVLWRGDSRAFACNYLAAHNWRSCTVCVQGKQGWAQVELPDFSTAPRPTGRLVEEGGNGQGHDCALAWLPGNQLRVEFVRLGTYIVDAKGQEHCALWFTLQLPAWVSRSHPRATLQTSRFALPSVDAGYF